MAVAKRREQGGAQTLQQLIAKVNLSMRKAFDKKMPGSKCFEAVYQNVVTIIVRTHYLLRFLISTFCVYT